MIRTALAVLAALVLSMLAAPVVSAEETRASVRDSITNETVRGCDHSLQRCSSRWSYEFRAAYQHQFETGLDDGGRLAVDRFAAQARIGYAPTERTQFGLSLGYRHDAHDFSGQGQTFPARPWNNIHFASITAPIAFSVSCRWSVRLLPTIRTAFEDGASWEDGVAGGGIFGATYRVNRCLTIGPAVGVLTQIEDDPLLFPFVFVDWTISSKLRLRSGRGLAATQGFGVFLEWLPNSRWRFSLGGRSERLRFRLDDRGVAPGGVGEHAGTWLFAGGTLRLGRRAEVTLSTGASLFGSLRLEDRVGNLLARDDYDAAPFVALDVQLDI